MLLVKNARIWTGNRKRPYAQDMVIDGKKILLIGTENDINEFPSIKPENVIDAENHMVIPSFLDPHTHVTAVADSMWILVLERGKYNSLDEILEAVREYSLVHPKEEVPFIYATSCPTEWMKNATKETFDKYVSDRPALLCDQGFHQCLINSCMLDMMEVSKNTPYDPSTTMNYERYEDGTPNGIVYEHRYEKDIHKMYEKINWYPPEQDNQEYLKPYLNQMNTWGIAGVLDGFTENEKTLKGFSELESSGKLHMYYHGNSLFMNLSDLDDAIGRAIEWQKKYDSDLIKTDSCKLFLDGTNEIGTAALMDPFVSDPNNFGKINMSEEDLCKAIIKLNSAKLHLQIHLVGDRAFHTAVNAYEKAKDMIEDLGRSMYTKVTLLHCELTKPYDRKRAAPLGIRINITPHWNAGCFGSEAIKYVGQDRFDTFYSFNDFFRTGAHISCSSDTVDKEDMPRTNPFVGIEVGHTRRDKDSEFEYRKPLSECLSVEDLMYGYTIEAADCMHESERAGSLEPGKDANFCILSQDVFDVPNDKIHDTTIRQAYFQGERIL